jgi:cation diffusion facilitator family transporter
MLKKGQKAAGQVSLIIIFLAVIKAAAGLISGSLILLTDAVHSASDVVSTFASFLGLKVAQKKPSDKFPYGYYKAESLAAIFVSAIIIAAAIEFLTEGYQALFTPSSLQFAPIALGAMGLSVVVDYFSSRYLKKIGTEINSQALLANAVDKRNDVFTSLVVILGLVLSFFKIPYVEGIVTMAIALLLLWTGITSLKESVFALLDVSPGLNIEEGVAQVVENVAGIEGYSELKLRKAGPFIFGETKVGIRKFVDVQKSHEIADRVEAEVQKKFPQITSFTVHVEPYKSEYQHLVFPVMEKKGLASKIAPRFGRSPHFLFVNLHGKEVKGFYSLDNPYLDKETKAGLAVAKLVGEQKSEILITKEIGEISLHTLRDYLIDVYQAKGEEVKENLALFLDQKLPILDQATKEVTE